MTGVALAGAAAAAVAFGGAGHAPDVEQWGTIDRLEIAFVAVPGSAVDLVMQWGDLGQYGEDAGGRAQVAAPDAFFPAVEQADADGGDGRAAKDQQRRLRVFVNADQLTVNGGHHRRRQKASRST